VDHQVMILHRASVAYALVALCLNCQCGCWATSGRMSALQHPLLGFQRNLPQRLLFRPMVTR
jgi:hypothetical protein